jgi:hypothetical protein
MPIPEAATGFAALDDSRTARKVGRMKSVIFAVLVSLSACATSSGPGPVNVHSVRVDIQRSIGDGRTITSMGKVTADSAVVYTNTAAGRREEHWSKTPQGWSMSQSVDVAAAR